ncbi:MAG: hypothetical protein U1E65_23970 [Myxococcota bacterium]
MGRWARAAAGLAAALGTVATSARASDLEGTVKVSSPPAAVLAHVTIDRHVCGQTGLVFESTVSVSREGLLDGAVAYLEPKAPAVSLPPRAKPDRSKPEPAVIDQKNCAFVPTVQVLLRGTAVRLRNSDPVFHNVHVFDEHGVSVTNVSMPLIGQEVQAFTADRPGRYSVRCDAGHRWMHAELLVLDHPYFAAVRRGSYRIPAVPPGSYWLVIFHPVLGERRTLIDVGSEDRIVRSVEF